jgi:hypothetical protein
MPPGRRIRRGCRQVRQGVERGRFGVIGQRGVNLIHCLFPPANAQPVIRRRGLEEERLRRGHEEPLSLCGWLQGLGLLHRAPTLVQRFGPRSRRPQRLKKRHGNAPIRHRAARIDRSDPSESLPCLRVRHVMQKRYRAVEFHLGLCGTANRKLNGARRMARVLLAPASRFGRASPKHHDHQSGRKAAQYRASSALHRQMPSHDFVRRYFVSTAIASCPSGVTLKAVIFR